MANIKEKKKELLSGKLDGIKLQDAGVKRSETPSCISVSSSKKGIDYPSIYLDIKEVPSLKGYEVEEDVTMVIKGKVISHSIDEGPNRSRENFSIQIKKVGVAPKK